MGRGEDLGKLDRGGDERNRIKRAGMSRGTRSRNMALLARYLVRNFLKMILDSVNWHEL